tara:strand:+ start:245 stop:718 length:474 start_codon:yes stop_codon:yes gene_type:complete
MIKIFELPKYYEILINIENGEVKIISNSKHAKGRELSLFKTREGYLRVKLNNKSVMIHSLVAQFILGDRPKDYVVNHIDGDKLNNRPSNLEYVTIAENIKHSVEHGLHICHRPKLSGRYKDGRCEDIVKYKNEWYLKNKQRILERMKNNSRDKKKCP